jgi:ATP-dependent Zn protease
MEEENKKEPVIEEPEEEYEDLSETPSGAEEEIVIKTPQDIPGHSEGKYDSLIEEDEDLKKWLEYKRLQTKEKNGLALTPEELQFKKDIEELQQKENQAEVEQERILKEQADLQKEHDEKLRQEYLQTKQENPGKIVQANEQEMSLSGGDSIPKLLGFIIAMKKAKKKGGKVLVQVFRNRKVLIKWTLNEVTFVEFFTKDEKGNELMEITRFSEYPYSYEGSPIPVLFAVQGYAEGFDFFSEFRKDLSSEMVSRLVTRAWHSGYLKGAEVAQPKNKNGMLGALTEWMPIILVIGLLVMGWLMYQMYGSMNEMYQTVQVMQSQMNTLVPVVDANALVLR